MTMDSLTKELLKAWKTSTGWAITFLAVTILALSTIPGVSLAGLSTFGLLFIAMQALTFTKSQSSEWRRVAIERLCKENKEKYERIASPIFNLFFEINATIGMKDRIKHITPFPENFTRSTISIIYDLEIINEHLIALDHNGIEHVISIFKKSLAIPSFKEHYEKHRNIDDNSFESSCEDFLASFNEFKHTLVHRDGRGLPGEIPELRFLSYIEVIHKDGISRTH